MSSERIDVLIVGAGPAGLSAAIALKRAGIKGVTVVDREPQAGGIPRLCHHTGFGLGDLRRLYSGPRYAGHYVRQAEAAGVDLRTSSTVTEWAGPTTLATTSPHGLRQIEARAILLATGCRERPRAARLVPGSRPQGIFTTGSLQRFVHQHHLPVGRRAVIVGAELVSLSALMTLAHAGVQTVMMVTELSQDQIYFPYRPMKWYLAEVQARVPIATETRIGRILGRGRVEGLDLVPLKSGNTRTIACDTVVFTGDWIPEHELARLGGLAIDPGTRGPRVDAASRTSANGVFAAGNLLRGAETADASALEGRRTARAILEYLQDGEWPEQVLPIRAEPPLAWILPNALSEPFRAGGFTFRVSEFGRNARLKVVQGDELLYTQSYYRLLPNTSLRLNGHWMQAVEPRGAEIRLLVD